MPAPSFSYSDVVHVLPSMQSLTDSQLSDLAAAINQTMPVLKQMVLMPAGDVYTFNGLDSTDQGFVTSRIKYRTQSTGKVI